MKKRFKKIYIEIINSCNFRCSFCYDSERKAKKMSVEQFQNVVGKIKNYTDFIYLHVLGEPMLHRDFQQIVTVAQENNLNVQITTNGSFLKKHKEFLLKNPVRQINISLHDAEENISKEKWSSFIKEMLEISDELSTVSYVSLRLWNQTVEQSNEFNQLCQREIEHFFSELPKPFDFLISTTFTLAPNLFLNLAPRFVWSGAEPSMCKKCYGLIDQLAILSNGDVVPCCIDADANLFLGNIFEMELEKIITGERAKNIENGFRKGIAYEEWCQKCGLRV